MNELEKSVASHYEKGSSNINSNSTSEMDLLDPDHMGSVPLVRIYKDGFVGISI